MKKKSFWSKTVVEDIAMMVSTLPKWHNSLSGCVEAAEEFGGVMHQYWIRYGDWPMGVLINLESIHTDELASHIAQNFLTLKMAVDENTVSTPIYKLRSACHRVI
jgi:hypothetical protein